MKIRNGFVSNSSSSSFIVLNENDIPRNVSYAKITDPELIEKIKERADMKKDCDELFLTQFVSDCLVEFDELYDNGAIEYCDGSHIGPYDNRDFIEIDLDVWVIKEDIV